MFNALRALPVGTIAPVRVRVINDLTWSDGRTTTTHAKTGEEGTLFARTDAGFMVKLDSGEYRQVFDFQGEDRLHRAEDEITIIS